MSAVQLGAERIANGCPISSFDGVWHSRYVDARHSYPSTSQLVCPLQTERPRSRRDTSAAPSEPLTATADDKLGGTKGGILPTCYIAHTSAIPIPQIGRHVDRPLRHTGQPSDNNPRTIIVQTSPNLMEISHRVLRAREGGSARGAYPKRPRPTHLPLVDVGTPEFDALPLALPSSVGLVVAE